MRQDSQLNRMLTVAVLYLNYFLHGIGCAVLGQALIKDSLSQSWGTSVMAITAISAALGLGRLVALPLSGPLSDKLGRKLSVILGGVLYAMFLLGLGWTSQSPDGYILAYALAILGGIANSFLDTGTYPALAEIITRAPSAATMGIKFSMAISQMLLPFLLGVTVSWNGDVASYATLFYVSGALYLVLSVLILLLPMPEPELKVERKSLLDGIRSASFTMDSVALIVIGFTSTGTFQLWLNCAQNYARDYAGVANPSLMQTYYSVGTLLAVVVTSVLTRRIRDVRFILLYPLICLMALLLAVFLPSYDLLKWLSFAIGWAGAGGLLQIVTTVCNTTFPRIKGTVTALVMIASSLCNYTLLSLASSMTSRQVLWMNVAVTLVGVLLGLLVNLRLRPAQAKMD